MKGLISLTHKYQDNDLFSTKPLIWPSAIPAPSELCPYVNLSLTEINIVYCFLGIKIFFFSNFLLLFMSNAHVYMSLINRYIGRNSFRSV